MLLARRGELARARRGGSETFRDILTTAAFRIDRKLSTAVILTHTSSAYFDADESKGGNGILEERVVDAEG